MPAKSYSDFLPRTQNSSVRPITLCSFRHPDHRGGQYRAIAAFDIAPDGSQFAVGYGDGSVYVVPTTATTAKAASSSRPHLSAVTSLQFFPSSRVLLTTGVDFVLTILSAEHLSTPPSERDGPAKVSPVRSLKGHSRAVTSAAIISRGRNVLSGSKDGTVRLWDVSSGNQIRMMGTQKYTGVLSMAAGDRGDAVFERPPDGEVVEGETRTPLSVDPREVDTADKLVFCGLSDGSAEVFDLTTKLSVTHLPAKTSAGLHAIAYSPKHSLLATGSSTGIIRVHDTRSLPRPLVSFQRNNASIEDVAWMSFPGGDVGLAIATEDGLPYVAHVRPEGPSVCAELVGPDCDAVRCVRVHGETGAIWTAGDDGVVRRYKELNP